MKSKGEDAVEFLFVSFIIHLLTLTCSAINARVSLSILPSVGLDHLIKIEDCCTIFVPAVLV